MNNPSSTPGAQPLHLLPLYFLSDDENKLHDKKTGTLLYDALECVASILRVLYPEQIAYAGAKARGEFQGFRALYDLMDAGALLPGVETHPLLASGDEVCQRFRARVMALAGSNICALAAEFRQPADYITTEALAMQLAKDREDAAGVEVYHSTGGDDTLTCTEDEREDYVAFVSPDVIGSSDTLDDATFARFVAGLRDWELLVEEKTPAEDPARSALALCLAYLTDPQIVEWLNRSGYGSDAYGKAVSAARACLE